MDNARWALKYLASGHFLCFGMLQGWETLEMTESPWAAKMFDSREGATAWKNNEGHVRHQPMILVELSFTTGIKEHGLVPLTEPTGWPEWRQPDGDTWAYDEHRRVESEEQYKELYKQHGLTPPPALPEKP